MGCTDVSASVAAIIAAFAQCREVLGKIKSKTPGKVIKNAGADINDHERRLAQSLSRAPAEIGQEYARGVQALGQPFAQGDGLTQMLLQTTLAKLNSGLVDIITAFLRTKDPKKLRLDYNALATLSDTSCVEAKAGLTQLARRLLRAALHLQPGPPCRNCGFFGHKECGGNATNKGRTAEASKKSTAPKAYIAGVRQANQTHWAMVRSRPQKKRVASSSSTSSSGSNLSVNSTVNSFSSNATTLLGTPPASSTSRTTSPAVTAPPPPYQQSRQPPHTKPQAGGAKTVVKPQPSRQQITQHQTKSQGNLRAVMQTSAPLPLKAEHLAQIPQLRKPPSTQRMRSSDRSQEQEATARYPQAIPRRRLDKSTDSTYSFASDSTKLGEIPMHKWPTPFDFDEMNRLNAEAGAVGWGGEYGVAPAAVPEKPAKKQHAGLLSKMFKRAPLSSISEAQPAS